MRSTSADPEAANAPPARGRWLGRAGTAAFLAAALGAGCGSEPHSQSRPTTEPPPDMTALDLTCPGEPLAQVPLRRLTRFELGNAVRDIFGFAIDLSELFPPDEVSSGFDDQADTIGLTDLHVEGYLKFGDQLSAWLGADPQRMSALTSCNPSDDGCVAATVKRLGRRVLRRPLGDDEVSALASLFSDSSDAGFRDGVATLATALIQSPDFLYRFEREANPDSSAGLASPWVLASRLSFLIWGSGPDDALLDAAENGQLASAQDVAAQAQRMIADPRTRAAVTHFYEQWLELVDFDDVEKDRRLLPLWTDELKSDFAAETHRFVDSVLWDDDARLQTLLLAPYGFVNSDLADFYGIPSPTTGTDLVKVTFPDNGQRVGLLTQGMILSTQAKANQTSPVHRGKFIRERFLCQPPAPPPANLVITPPRLDPRQTTRERFAAHTADPNCASCHQALDPIGFSFEHYDATGRYRDTESDLPVDASGELTGTDVDGPLDGVPSLAARLAGSRQVQNCAVSEWFRYAYGRGDSADETCTVQKLDDAFATAHGDLRALLLALTQTNAFLLPTPAPAPEEDAP